MLTIPAKTVYIDPGISRKPNCQRRLDRVLPHVRCADIRELDKRALQAVRNIPKRRHGKDDFGDDAVLVFTTFDEQQHSWFYHWRDERYMINGTGPRRSLSRPPPGAAESRHGCRQERRRERFPLF